MKHKIGHLKTWNIEGNFHFNPLETLKVLISWELMSCVLKWTEFKLIVYSIIRIWYWSSFVSSILQTISILFHSTLTFKSLVFCWFWFCQHFGVETGWIEMFKCNVVLIMWDWLKQMCKSDHYCGTTEKLGSSKSSVHADF